MYVRMDDMKEMGVGGRPQGHHHMNGDALAGYGLCHLPIRPNHPAGGGYQSIHPISIGFEGDETFSPSGVIEVDEAFGPSPYAPTAGNPPAWFSQPPSVGNGAASQDTSSRGTNCVIRKVSHERPGPKPHMGMTQPASSALLSVRYLRVLASRPGLIYWGQPRLFGQVPSLRTSCPLRPRGRPGNRN